MTSDRPARLVGVVPAAGAATRLGPIPCSKAILPVAGEGPRPGSVRVACHSLLEAMATAGVVRCNVVVDRDRTDVCSFLGDGSDLGLDLAYLTVTSSPSTVVTLDRARQHVGDAVVVLGFPDILVEPVDVLARVVSRYRAGETDVVLGLLRTEDPTVVDVVDVDDAGVVHRVVPKPGADSAEASLAWMWAFAVWGPRFTDLLHEHATAGTAGDGPEQFVGDVVADALGRGLRVEAVRLEGARYLDIGTAEALAAAQRAPLDRAGTAPSTDVPPGQG